MHEVTHEMPHAETPTTTMNAAHPYPEQVQRVKIFPPEPVTEELLQFCEQVSPRSTPFYVLVPPGGRVSAPMPVHFDDKNAVRGWSILQWETAMLEFESYMVLRKPNGQWVAVETRDITPYDSILFLPDTHAPAPRTAHVRFPLSDSPCVARYISLAAQKDELVRHALSTGSLKKQELRKLFDYEAELDVLVELFPRTQLTS